MKPQHELIHEAMSTNGITNSELARHVGVSRQYIADVRKGRQAVTNPDTMKAIADYIDSDPDDLMLSIGRVPSDVLTMMQEQPQLVTMVRLAYSQRAGNG